MYWNDFEGGHNAVGVTAPSLNVALPRRLHRHRLQDLPAARQSERAADRRSRSTSCSTMAPRRSSLPLRWRRTAARRSNANAFRAAAGSRVLDRRRRHQRDADHRRARDLLRRLPRRQQRPPASRRNRPSGASPKASKIASTATGVRDVLSAREHDRHRPPTVTATFYLEDGTGIVRTCTVESEVAHHAERQGLSRVEQQAVRGVLRIDERRDVLGGARGLLGRQPLWRPRQHRHGLDRRDRRAAGASRRHGHEHLAERGQRLGRPGGDDHRHQLQPRRAGLHRRHAGGRRGRARRAAHRRDDARPRGWRGRRARSSATAPRATLPQRLHLRSGRAAATAAESHAGSAGGTVASGCRTWRTSSTKWPRSIRARCAIRVRSTADRGSSSIAWSHRLRQFDTRWGYNCKRGNCPDISQDVVAYHAGAGPEVNGALETYTVDVIRGHCGPQPGALVVAAPVRPRPRRGPVAQPLPVLSGEAEVSER